MLKQNIVLDIEEHYFTDVEDGPNNQVSILCDDYYDYGLKIRSLSLKDIGGIFMTAMRVLVLILILMLILI